MLARDFLLRFCGRGGGCGGGIGGTFWLADGGDGLDVEFLVIEIARGAVHLDSLHQEDADIHVDLLVGGEPHFVVHVGLLQDHPRALLQIGEQAAGKFHVVDEEGVEAHDVEGFLVNPYYAAEFLDDFFDEAARFEFRVGLEIEDQYILAAKTFAARIDELAGAEERVNGDVLAPLRPSALACSFSSGLSFLLAAFSRSSICFKTRAFSFFWASALSGWPLIFTRVETSVPWR